MLNEKLHFYYSGRQEMILRTMGAGPNTCMVNGTEYPYTECHTTKNDHAQRFADSEYIGFGKICRIYPPTEGSEFDEFLKEWIDDA